MLRERCRAREGSWTVKRCCDRFNYWQKTKQNKKQGWGFSSVVERLPSKRKALGSVPSSEKKFFKTKNKNNPPPPPKKNQNQSSKEERQQEKGGKV